MHTVQDIEQIIKKLQTKDGMPIRWGIGWGETEVTGEQLIKVLKEYQALLYALSPSGDTKYAYYGEFSFEEELYNPELEDYYPETFTVPWTTIKDIMKAILHKASIGECNEP